MQDNSRFNTRWPDASIDVLNLSVTADEIFRSLCLDDVDINGDEITAVCPIHTRETGKSLTINTTFNYGYCQEPDCEIYFRKVGAVNLLEIFCLSTGFSLEEVVETWAPQKRIDLSLPVPEPPAVADEEFSYIQLEFADPSTRQTRTVLTPMASVSMSAIAAQASDVLTSVFRYRDGDLQRLQRGLADQSAMLLGDLFAVFENPERGGDSSRTLTALGEGMKAAQRDAATYVETLWKKFGLSRNVVYPYMNGSGIDLQIDYRVFGVRPASDLHRIYERMTDYIAGIYRREGRGVVTQKIKQVLADRYSNSQKWRAEGSRSTSTQLHKVPLHIEELLSEPPIQLLRAGTHVRPSITRPEVVTPQPLAAAFFRWSALMVRDGRQIEERKLLSLDEVYPKESLSAGAPGHEARGLEANDFAGYAAEPALDLIVSDQHHYHAEPEQPAPVPEALAFAEAREAPPRSIQAAEVEVMRSSHQGDASAGDPSLLRAAVAPSPGEMRRLRAEEDATLRDAVRQLQDEIVVKEVPDKPSPHPTIDHPHLIRVRPLAAAAVAPAGESALGGLLGRYAKLVAEAPEDRAASLFRDLLKEAAPLVRAVVPVRMDSSSDEIMAELLRPLPQLTFLSHGLNKIFMGGARPGDTFILRGRCDTGVFDFAIQHVDHWAARHLARCVFANFVMDTSELCMASVARLCSWSRRTLQSRAWFSSQGGTVPDIERIRQKLERAFDTYKAFSARIQVLPMAGVTGGEGALQLLIDTMHAERAAAAEQLEVPSSSEPASAQPVVLVVDSVRMLKALFASVTGGETVAWVRLLAAARQAGVFLVLLADHMLPATDLRELDAGVAASAGARLVTAETAADLEAELEHARRRALTGEEREWFTRLFESAELSSQEAERLRARAAVLDAIGRGEDRAETSAFAYYRYRAEFSELRIR
ncbi:MAG: hypothetical protein HYV63_11665 [Candidatus Schekmanbacteria bacterium]|nr:hypothetical protein [Candidatus Schekmanbacteria bacterium]